MFLSKPNRLCLSHEPTSYLTDYHQSPDQGSSAPPRKSKTQVKMTDVDDNENDKSIPDVGIKSIISLRHEEYNDF